MSDPTAQSVLFADLFDKPTKVVFDGQAQSSDGGAGLLGKVDRAMGLTRDLAAMLDDPRDPARIEHAMQDLFRQRVFSIALGYADQSDAARVGADPIFKGLVGRGPVRGADLASQPTLSRFEHTPSARELVDMSRHLESVVVDRLRRRHPNARRITIDMDPSCDKTYGGQQGTLFNGYYRTWCYLPIFGFVSVDDDPEQYLFCARLRPGLAKEGRASLPTIRRMVKRLRSAFGRVQILVRLDSGFAHPRLFDALEEMQVKYVVGMPRNKRLEAACEEQMEAAAAQAARDGQTSQVYGECDYGARSWSRERRVVFKAQVLVAEGKADKKNARFVVHNLSRSYKPETIYRRVYCGRGDSENRIKELKGDLEIDRTSDTGFLANQFRVLMTAVAYVLFQELRAQLATTEASRWQVGTIRERLLKVGARVVESVRRVVVHLAAACPWSGLWLKAARRLGAAPG